MIGRGSGHPRLLIMSRGRPGVAIISEPMAVSKTCSILPRKSFFAAGAVMVRCQLPYDGAFFEFLRGQYEAVSRVAIGKAWRRHELGFAPSAGNKPLDINVINCGACHCRPALPPQLEQQRNKRWDISTHCLLNGSWNQMKPRSSGRCSA